MIKRLLIFILCFAVWSIGFLFNFDYSYYNQLILPGFAPDVLFFPIAWTIVYLCIAFSVSSIFSSIKFKDIPISYKLSLIINYIFNQSFIIVFFGLKNNLLGFISCIGTFISSLFLYQESFLLKEKSTLILRLYVLLSFFATILSLAVYLLNV